MSILNIKKIVENETSFKISFLFEDYSGIKMLKQICLGLVYKRVLLKQALSVAYDHDRYSKIFLDAFKNIVPEIPDFPLVIQFDSEGSCFLLSAENAEDTDKLNLMLEG